MSETGQRKDLRERVVVEVDLGLYPEDVVFKALYWYGGEYEVEVERSVSGLLVALWPREGALSPTHADALEARLRRDLVDFKTRSIVAQETQVVRELLVAKAFASFEEVDHVPPGSAEDPVGFRLADWDVP